MSTSPDRRSRKRLATRQAISDAATRLFLERGFDAVTVDEIAAAADVGRMTVFNHFPRKEDMFYDRDEEGRDLLRETLRQRDPRVAPVETLRQLAHRLVTGRNPVVDFSARSGAFVATAAESETLKARARAIRDELAAVLRVALLRAHRTFGATRRTEAANAAFLAIIDRGTAGLRAALAGTPYAEAAAP